MKIHEKYLKRCLELAKFGWPAAMPNPSVGAVIVYEDQIIGEGFTAAYGGPHAEVNAIKNVKDKSLLKEATLYVSLEPCSHFGKTPPCCDLILKHDIPRIVVGTMDPHSVVAGNGIKKLQDAGKNVTVGVLEKECIALNRRFFTFHQKKRPYIILKWAESKDGFIAPTSKSEQKPVWITNDYSRQLVHKWRTEEQAILIGTQTAIDDNPKLNARDWYGKNPIKIVLDQKNRIPKENYIFDNQSETLLITADKINFDKKVGKQISTLLFENDIQSVIIEGGSRTLQTFLDENLWDEARIFKGPIVFGTGVKAPQYKGTFISKSSIRNDELLIFKNHD